MFTLSADQLDLQLSCFTLVFLRISAMLLGDAIFGSRLLPVRLRLMLSLSLGFMVFPFIHQPSHITLFSITGGILAIQQLVIGLMIATLFQCIFQVAVFAGQLVAYQFGLGFATLMDPSSQLRMGIIGELYYFATLVLFLSFNGHLMVLQFLVNSFTTLPIDHIPTWQINFQTLTQFAGIIFSGGMTIALPGITALLIVNTTFAIMTRSAPQMNIFSVGFPVMLILGLAVLTLTFPGVMSTMHTYFMDGFSALKPLLGGA